MYSNGKAFNEISRCKPVEDSRECRVSDVSLKIQENAMCSGLFKSFLLASCRGNEDHESFYKRSGEAERKKLEASEV